MSFRYDIGFLRALAVVIVVFFHYQVPFFQGGFIGVDIFFVISGFLMTTIILKKTEANTFNLLDFYKRRFVRIVPALITTIIGVLLLTFFLYFPIDFKQVSLYSFFSSIFLSNYYYLFNSGYFDPSSQSNILLHTWSLSVEWQFYIIYPLFLMMSKNLYLKKTKTFNIIFSVLLISSLLLVIGFNNFLPVNYTKVSFFSFTHRAWEMMLGGVAFLYNDFFVNKISAINKKVITVLCFLGILISTVFFTDDKAWPSLLTLLPVVSTFLLIAITRDYSFYRNKQVQYVGSISYSWYLWHWPLYVISKYFGYGSWGVLLLIFLLSIFVSVLSYEIIEKKTKIIPTKLIFITTLFVLVFTAFSSVTSVNNSLFDKEIINLTEFKTNYETTRRKQFHSGICHNTHRIDYESCLTIKQGKRNILLLGDSHAGQFSYSFRNKLDTVKYNFIEHTVVGSFPLLGVTGEKSATKEFNEILNNFIPVNKEDIDVIIISCNWLNSKTNSGHENAEDLADGINKTINYIEKNGIKVIILGQTEKYVVEYPMVKSFAIMNKEIPSPIVDKSRTLNTTLKKMIPQKNYVELYMLENIEHYNTEKNIPYMFDQNHLTIYGANQVVDYLITNKII